MKEKGGDRDSLMRTSYYIVTRNFTKTINRFVVFIDDGKSIEIPHESGHRVKFVDMLIEYFEGLEEYEKCNRLLMLRELIIMVDD
jgi:hypothetical protein